MNQKLTTYDSDELDGNYHDEVVEDDAPKKSNLKSSAELKLKF